MPRFVVLTHDHPTLHWDLMLEAGPILRTWRLAQPPDVDGPIDAEVLPDHRLLYLDYEGPVSDGRGSVARWDRGEYELVAGTTDDRVLAEFNGEKLRGMFVFERSPASLNWMFRANSNERSRS
jgi:hypothetical protein